jgi:hypothetical protein
MIFKYIDFIKEAFSKPIKSVLNFVKDIDNNEQLLNDIKTLCHRYDIQLSKLNGEYLKTKKAIELQRNGIVNLWFSADNRYLFKTNDKNDFIWKLPHIQKNSDFAIVIDIDKQERLDELVSKRNDNKPISKNDSYHRQANYDRYKKMLFDKKRPVILSNIVDKIVEVSKEGKYTVYELCKMIKDNVDDSILFDIIEILYKKELLTHGEYFKLEMHFKYGSKY